MTLQCCLLSFRQFVLLRSSSFSAQVASLGECYDCIRDAIPRAHLRIKNVQSYAYVCFHNADKRLDKDHYLMGWSTSRMRGDCLTISICYLQCCDELEVTDLRPPVPCVLGRLKCHDEIPGGQGRNKWQILC